MSADMEVARTVINRIAVARGISPPHPGADAALPDWLDGEDVTCWGAEELGAMREGLLDAAAGKRAAQGSWYTPYEVALPMTRFSLDIAATRMIEPGDPNELFRICAYDPACGCGVFMVAAARDISARYVTAVCGPLEGMNLWRAASLVMPDVMRECVFGVDRDEVAVEIARAVLWFAVGGVEPYTFMDGNVIVGNTLEGDEPPALTAKYRGQTLAERTGRPAAPHQP